MATLATVKKPEQHVVMVEFAMKEEKKGSVRYERAMIRQ